MKKNLLKQLTSVALATAMLGTMGVAAFAEDPTVTPGTDANSYLIKYLEAGDGVTVPAGTTFTINFEQTGYNEETPTGAYAVAINPVTFTTGTGEWKATNDADDEAALYIEKSFSDILNGVTFPAAGRYTYTVTETNGGVEGFTYDDTEYIVDIYVKNGGSKTITVWKDGTQEEGGAKQDATKTDPTKDEVEQNGDGNVTVQGFTFDNKYVKTNEKEDKNEEGFLNISKTVVGDYGDRTYPFEFTINLTKPKNAPADAVAKYSVYEKDAPVDAAPVRSGTMNYGEDVEFNLKHDEVLRFYVIEAGTKYTVTETLSTSGVTKAEEYTASATATVGGEAKDVNTVGKHTDLAVGEYVVDDKLDTLDDIDYTNTFDDDSVSPTGILINNAPYILLALVAAGGMTFYVVKRRREEN
ncbi:MAG TPA: QVPTGV class sortase B protein-sorting domain-containing protein [Clostridiales bacterium]|nr:QVPTGV class sortase B protein-sorting domain-containing protein [Clostridiales bacterium]